MFDEYRDQETWFRVTAIGSGRFVGDYDTEEEAEDAAFHDDAKCTVRRMRGLGA